MNPALSLQRNSTMWAMSIGLPTRPAGCCVASGPSYAVPVVSIHPGDMEFTLALPARLTAREWVSAAMPPLAAV